MFKKLLLLLIVIAPMSLFAQDKLAYINAQEIFAKMPELKDVESKLAAKNEAFKKTAEGMQAEYNALVEKFQKDTIALTESIIMDRQTQLENLEKRYQTFMQKSSTELEQEQQALMAPLQQKIRQAIKEVGDENGYTYIFDATTLLHVSATATDANAKVKAKLGITN